MTNQKIQDYIKNGSKGDLKLNNVPIKSLPDELKIVRGSLDLEKSLIESLPDGLVVQGYLDVSETPIKSLPKGLKVGEHLYAATTALTTVPPRLKVGGSLHLSSSPINSLPDDLMVGDMLVLFGTPLGQKYKLKYKVDLAKEVEKLYPGVKGFIYL